MAYDIEKWKHIMRPWGNEVRFTATDTDTDKVYNEVIRISAKATEKDVVAAITAKLDRITTAEANAPEPEIIYTKSEIETLLRDKGYLTEEQGLDDLAAKGQ